VTASFTPKRISPIPHSLVLTLCWLSAILYGVWILPETVFIRHFCMVAGAILSLYVIYQNSRLLLQKEAAPIWMIVLLMLWVTFHLFFIGQDFERQWDEYTRIWKKIAVSTVFAIGLGMALISQAGNQKNNDYYWKIIFLGFLLPAITYFVKYGVTNLAPKYGFTVPIYLVLDPDHMGSRFGISRAWYVFFCLPAVVISIGLLTSRIKNNTFNFYNSFVYLFCIPTTALIFYLENDRLGTFFSFLLVLIAIVLIGFSLVRKKALVGLLIFALISGLSASILWGSFKQNPEWMTLLADARVAVQQVDKLDNWKYNRILIKGYPPNEYGETVSPSNYERISWAIVGGRFVPENPLGYGLLSLSFGALGKQQWPDSEMSWSHSAWLDFTLGYGIPAFMLLVGAVLLTWRNARHAMMPWRLIGRWGLPILAAVLLVKEISSEVFINAFCFLIIFCAALSLPSALSRKPKND
jgi:hypothetical protein